MPGGLALEKPGAGSAYPLRSAPSSAARKAPMIPPQKRSGTSTAKCHNAMPTMAQMRTLMARSLDAARAGQDGCERASSAGRHPTAGEALLAVAARPAARGLGDRVRRERRGDQQEQDHEHRAGN